MALMQYSLFYRMYGIRLVDQLIKPPMPVLTKLELPADSYYHYLGVSSTDDGPTESTLAIDANKRQFMIATIEDLAETEGSPRKASIQIDKLARNHRVRNPRFRPLKDLASIERDSQMVGIFNYSFLHRAYKYMRTQYSNYYRWRNIHATMWKKMGDIARQSARNQFIEFDLPRVIPGVSMLDRGSGNMTQNLAAAFSNSESLALLEVWKWLGENRADSLLHYIDPGDYNKINIIFRESTNWFVVNLGKLNEWRGLSKQERAENPDVVKRGYPPNRMQRRFLFSIVALSAARSTVVPENLGTDVKDESAVTSGQGDATTVAIATPEITKVGKDGKTIEVQTGPVVTKVEKVKPTKADEAAFVDEVTRDEQAEKEAEKEDPYLQEELAADHQLDELSKAIDADLSALDEINTLSEISNVVDDNIEYILPKARSLEDSILQHANALADAGGLSAAEYRRVTENAGNYKKIVAPNNEPMGQFIQINPAVVKIKAPAVIPPKKTVTDKSMLESTLIDFDKKYVTEVMQRDTANMVMAMHHAGIMVTDYKAHETEDITGGRIRYVVKVKPLQGVPSTIRFDMPKVEPDGSFKINGVNYRTRKQRGDMPIRKINPGRVALTSYYGKIFVERSPKKINDYGRWLREWIMQIGLDKSKTLISNMVTGDCFYHELPAPRLYTMIAQGFRTFSLEVKRNGVNTYWKLIFDLKQRKALFSASPDPEAALANIEKDGFTVIGMTDGGRILVMDNNNAIYELNSEGTAIPTPSFEELLGIAGLRAPVEYAEVRVFGKMIPLGVMLAYLMGMEELCRRLGVKPRVVPAGQRTGVTPGEWTMAFQDETWVFNRDDTLATVVLGGWRDYRESTMNYPHHEFDRRDVYFNVLEENGLGVRYLREMDLLSQMFIDPITKELLTEMKEPDVWTELLIRAAQLLETDQHPHELDARFMRIKGYERFAGLMYSELVKSIRVHNAKGSKSTQPVEMNPFAVWIAISEDPAKDQSLEINPLKELKEIEAVTYSGTGGRSGRSMVKRTRAYHPTDMGVISEATTDSSDVGINTYLTANPKFNNLRGTADPYQVGKSGNSTGLSTTALVSVAADQDDMKRVNFISIQRAHGVACEGYHQTQIRTGYEQVMAYRTGTMYSYMAKKPGKVRSVNDTGIIIEYEDGELQGVEIGRRYGNAAGLVIPHEIVSPLQAGDVFHTGDPIAYNSGFFEPDFFNPKQIVWKFSTSSKTVLLESTDTLEDSCAISNKLSGKLKTRITKVRTIIVNFDQEIHRMVKPKDDVEYDSILCMIESAVSAGGKLLDEQTVDTLRFLTNQSPKAKIRGSVERIEVFYHGEKEDMSPSLRAMANESDSKLAARHRSQNKRVFSGSVDENFRVENDSLQLDTAAIRVYITTEVPAGVGDKGVFGNQMKTVFGRVFNDNVRTETGTPIDAIFGAKSIDDRIVMSPTIIGTSATLLNVIARKAVEAYES